MNPTVDSSHSLALVLMATFSAAFAGAQEVPLDFTGSTPRVAVSVPNGNFEQGRTIWAESSTNALTLIRRLSEVGVVPRSGEWGAVLGIANNEIAYIEQTVSVPSDTKRLNYWYQLGSFETHLGFDFARVVIDGWDVIDEFQLTENDATLVWTLRSADISSYAGRTVQIRIAAEIDVAEPSTLLVEDVHFETDGPSMKVFADGFESRDTTAWSGEWP